MSGHAPQIVAGGQHAWVHCECGWQSGLIRPRPFPTGVTRGMAASLAWARHLADTKRRRAR